MIDNVFRLRHPDVFTTNGYAGDIITTNADMRFDPDTVIAQIDEVPWITRDGASYAVVDLGVSGSAYYPTRLHSPMYNRSAFNKHIDRTFNEF